MIRKSIVPSLREYKRYRRGGLTPITDYYRQFHLPVRTDWRGLVGELTAGQCVYVASVGRARLVEACMDTAGIAYRRVKLLPPETGYLVWCVSVGPATGAVVDVVCDPCTLVRHEHCWGGGCVCDHKMPVVAGDRIEARISPKWDVRALDLLPGRAFMVPSYATAMMMQRAVDAEGKGVKIKLDDGTYLVWNIGRPPQNVCLGCEKGLCVGQPQVCRRGTIRGKRSPIECCCRHERIVWAFERGNVEARD